MALMIELDGSHEEGGGQILRTALGLSVLTQKPFRITNIRKNRDEPGLKAQHLSCIKACAELANASVSGASIGSTEVEFIPKAIKNRQMEVNIGTAGSVTLLLQSMLMPIIFTECDIKMMGGTDVKWSIPLDYLRYVILPFLNKFTRIDIKCEKRGYYPAGGGSITVNSRPKYKRIDFDSFEKFHQYIFGNPAIDLTKIGRLMSIKGVSNASIDLQDRKVAERQAVTAHLTLAKLGGTRIDSEYSNTTSTGSGIVLFSTFKIDNPKEDSFYKLGADALGDKNMKAEEVGRIAAEKLMSLMQSRTIVDECMQDNIIPLLGLFGGKIKTGEVTCHTKANIEVCSTLLDVDYNIENHNDASFISVLSSKRA